MQDYELQAGNGYLYHSFVKNNTEDTLENINVAINIGEAQITSAEIEIVDLEGTLIEKIEKQVEDNAVMISKLEPNQQISISLDIVTPVFDDTNSKDIQLYVSAEINHETYYSNLKISKVNMCALKIVNTFRK